MRHRTNVFIIGLLLVGILALAGIGIGIILVVALALWKLLEARSSQTKVPSL